ncbi:MAG TPA: hypothetical protein VGJ32_01155 [Solirubrobacteraceae bacterium]|jgi:Ca2+-binding RTX toxin-like protein
MPRRVQLAALTALAFLTTAGPAAAAQLSVSQNTDRMLVYKAEPGERNQITVARDGGSLTLTDPGAGDITMTHADGAGCKRTTGSVTCDKLGDLRLKINAGDGDDTVTVSSPAGVRVEGDGGDDVLAGGDGADTLDGGAGDDRLSGGGGADSLRGGDGADTADYSATLVAVSVTPDGTGDDGALGEGDDVGSDVESVVGGAASDDLTAGGGGGTLDGGPGNDTLRGGAASDRLAGGDGDDRLVSADDSADTVSCGAGTDAVEADPLDTVADDCESRTDTTATEPAAPGDAGDRAPSSPTKVAAAPARGTVLVTRPGGRPRELQEGESIPADALVDARHGSVTLTAAPDTAGNPQRATFTGGQFRVRRVRDPLPVTELTLAGSALAACPGAKQATAAARRPPVRRVWGSGHGRFRTRGRFAAATVRGTIWLTEDRCDGTLVRVKRGVVSVRDRVRNRSVTVRAGQRYLARAR